MCHYDCITLRVSLSDNNDDNDDDGDDDDDDKDDCVPIEEEKTLK